MKTIGLLGGMSWESTELYYRKINEGIKQALGGFHSAQIVMVSLDFHEMEILQRNNEWDRAATVLAGSARQIQAGGADFLLICTNTMHKVAPQIAQEIDIPILHIVDATAKAVKAQGKRTVGLLGTSFTMEQDFYRRGLEEHGLAVIIPGAEDRAIVHRVIYDELCLGVVKDESRQRFLSVIEGMRQQGAEAVIEGCTEINLLVQQTHTQVSLFDTTTIHAEHAVRLALAD